MAIIFRVKMLHGAMVIGVHVNDDAENLLIPGNYATSLLSRRYYRLNIIFCGSLRIRRRFRIRIIFQKFARISDTQGRTEFKRITKCHIGNVISATFIRCYARSGHSDFVSQLLLRHAALQSEFPHAHVSILP